MGVWGFDGGLREARLGDRQTAKSAAGWGFRIMVSGAESSN